MALGDPIPNVEDGDLIRTDWGKAVRDELNSNTVKKLGAQTMAGPLTVTNQITANGQIVISDTTPTSATHATRKDYVDDGDAAKLNLTGGVLSGSVTVGANPYAAAGTRLETGGRITGREHTLDEPTLYLARAGSGGAANLNQRFVTFDRVGTSIGSITIATSTTVAYNTSSDPRLKQITGDVVDAASLVQTLGATAFRGRWIDPATGTAEADGSEWIMLSSHDIEDVAPFAVTGNRDAVTDTGTVDPQQVNYPALVPLLMAALSQALDRIAALEAAA